MLLSFKTLAPGEARTLDLRISLSVLTYKYDALTDCATGARLYRRQECVVWVGAALALPPLFQLYSQFSITSRNFIAVIV